MLLATPKIPWGFAFLANVFYFYCIYGLSSCVSMVVGREDAPLLATMISLIVGILSGSAPPLSSAKKWHLEWLWRASPGTWLAELCFGQLVGPLRYLYSVDLASKATDFHLSFLWRNMAILVGIGTIYRIAAYVGLVFGHRLRR
ncbi:ABC transporter [Cordyceps javanica]|nr:ABC transporter [Cordyceps javanica]